MTLYKVSLKSDRPLPVEPICENHLFESELTLGRVAD